MTSYQGVNNGFNPLLPSRNTLHGFEWKNRQVSSLVYLLRYGNTNWGAKYASAKSIPKRIAHVTRVFIDVRQNLSTGGLLFRAISGQITTPRPRRTAASCRPGRQTELGLTAFVHAALAKHDTAWHGRQRTVPLDIRVIRNSLLTGIILHRRTYVASGTAYIQALYCAARHACHPVQPTYRHYTVPQDMRAIRNSLLTGIILCRRARVSSGTG